MTGAATTRQAVDWPTLLFELDMRGYSAARVAAECIRSDAWVSRLKHEPGAEPRYADGLVLIGLWRRAIGQPHAEPPLL